MLERRHRRSGNKTEALNLLLESHRKRLNVRTLVVATRDGRLLGWAGDDPGNVAMAATTVDETRGGAPEADGMIATWRLRAGGSEVVLGSFGGKLSYDVGSGIRRILG
jgi:hypothetical protein